MATYNSKSNRFFTTSGTGRHTGNKTPNVNVQRALTKEIRRNASPDTAVEDIEQETRRVRQTQNNISVDRYSSSTQRNNLYTAGNEFTLRDGSPYEGNYHIDPNLGAVVGATPSTTNQDILTPISRLSSTGQNIELSNRSNFNTVPRNGNTTMEGDHKHEYYIDANGNGIAYDAIHPNEPRIKHSHQIVNYNIIVNQSDCHPNCNQLYGYNGIGPHSHNFSYSDIRSGGVTPRSELLRRRRRERVITKRDPVRSNIGGVGNNQLSISNIRNSPGLSMINSIPVANKLAEMRSNLQTTSVEDVNDMIAQQNNIVPPAEETPTPPDTTPTPGGGTTGGSTGGGTGGGGY